MNQIQSVHFQPGFSESLGSFEGVLSHTHTYSSRFASDKRSALPDCYDHMAEWCVNHAVRAVGMGSPYTPETAKLYARYDNTPEGREEYFGGKVDPQSLCCREQQAEMLRLANAAGDGRVLFFLDNETPKGRYGHLWWVGYTCEFPAWHDYDQPFDRWMGGETAAGNQGDEPVPYTRRPYREIVARQRQAGGLGVWAHPTSWWFAGEGDQKKFITNIATEMPAHCFADGFLDGLVVMGYDPWRPEYIALWEALLDRGYRIPGAAEMDAGLHPATLESHKHILLSLIEPKKWDTKEMVSEFKAGRLCASSGPKLNLTVDGRPMGGVAETAKNKLHKIRIETSPAPDEKELGCIELIGFGGKVLHRSGPCPAGVYELTLPGGDSRGYCYARAFGEGFGEAPADHSPDFVAVSNPVYLHPEGQGFTPPMQTGVDIQWAENSPWKQGQVILETPDGEAMEQFAVESAALSFDAPANGRLRFISANGQEKVEYLINANAPLQDIQRYLYRGRFLNDFDAVPGEAPVDAWRLDDYRRSMEHVALER